MQKEIKIKRRLRNHCDGCGIKVRRFKVLKKLNGGYYCSKCVIKKRKEHREFLKRKVLGIRKRKDIMKECKERKEKEKNLRKIVSSKPNIKSIKSIGIRVSALGIYLTKNEKLVLYKKLIKKGLTGAESNKRIKNLINQMKLVKEKIKETTKTKEELNKRFKEEFAKLVEMEI